VREGRTPNLVMTSLPRHEIQLVTVRSFAHMPLWISDRNRGFVLANADKLSWGVKIVLNVFIFDRSTLKKCLQAV